MKKKFTLQVKRLIKVSDQYNIEGSDLTLLKNKMILSSNKKCYLLLIIFQISINLIHFEYSINEEILKGEENRLLQQIIKKIKVMKYFFEDMDLSIYKENKFLAKDM